MKTIRTAVVGLGPRGLFFARMYDRPSHPGFELRAVCDIDPKALYRARRVLGDKVAYFRGVGEMLAAKAPVDAVIVATDDPHHVEPTVAALRAGKHVMVEKPLCQTVEDARLIVSEARRARGIFMIGFELRECVVFLKMRRLLDEGRIGDVRIGHAFDNVSVGGNYFFHSARKRKAHYRSLLLQKATHSLDLLNWFMGSVPAKVYATGG
ncbi:MAG: Gfo/Idh/MocA family oxidoreductase, partial [Planctomycetota bacterium]|nr:Gfo/Idh/MocA family oxidoreductase [Planctomycetota bacterium]